MKHDSEDQEAGTDLPLDVCVDRRSFLSRMGVLGTLAGAAAALPAIDYRRAYAAGSGLSNDAYAQTVRPEALADPTECTIAEAATLIRTGKLSPVTLAEAYIARIDAYDADYYKAFNTVLRSDALAAAAAAASSKYLGPMQGVFLGIKDNYYTAGVLTTANSYIFEDFVPTFDATAVVRLKAAGGIMMGKMQMGPLATTRATTPDGVTTTRNAWTPNNASTDPGGSSSGSATATAGRMVTSSIGTQTGGSITAPSNAQALTGLKPTVGRVPLYGIIPLTYTRDHPGPLARDAKDAAIMLQVMAGPDVNDPRSRGLPDVPDLVRAATPVKKNGAFALRWPTRIGVIPGYTNGTSASAVARTAMLNTFQSLGAQIVDVTLPAEWDLLTGTAFNNVRLPERSEPFLEYLRQDVRLFGVSLGSWIQGLFLGGEDYLKGQRAKYLLMQRVLFDLFDQCDVVVQTGPVPFDILGLPEIAFNIGFNTNAQGLPVPIGAIFGGAPYAEDRLLSLVAAFQAVTDFHLKRPADPVVTLAARRAAFDDAPVITMEEAMLLTE